MAKRRSADLSSILAPLADVVRRLRTRRDELAAELGAVDAQLGRLEGGANGSPRRGPGSRGSGDNGGGTGGGGGRRKGKRIRRKREDIEAVAQEIVKFIQDGGKEGRSGRDIKSKFGAILPSTKAFLKEYAPDAKIKTSGLKATMRYHGA